VLYTDTTTRPGNKRRLRASRVSSLGLHLPNTYSKFNGTTARARQLIFQPRYLVLIPSTKPRLYRRPFAGELSFLPVITDRANKLKVCLVHVDRWSIYATLYANYRPCSTDVCEVMVCAGLVAGITDADYSHIHIYLSKCNGCSLNSDIDDEELESAFDRQQTDIKAWSSPPVSFRDTVLYLPEDDDVPNDFFSRLSVDLINLGGAQVHFPGSGPDGCDMPMSVVVHDATFDAALAFARSVSDPCEPGGSYLTPA
jgi:hypothetical protein